MEDHKELEQPRPADGPRLVIATAVDRVQHCHDGSVDQSNGDGHVRREQAVVDVGPDGERVRQVVVIGWRRENCWFR